MLVILLLTFPLWLWIAFVCVYALYFDGYELIVLAAVFEGFYGGQYAFPFTLLTTSVATCFGLWLQPRFLFYTK